jgi:chorismate dehydratase
VSAGLLPLPMHPTRVGIVRYLNTVPMTYGLEKLAGLTMVPAVPARIVDLITSGEVDLGLASVVDAVRATASGTPMALIPAGMIGCDGPTLTVRLFSSVPIDQVTTVHADTDSHTSVILCRVVLSKLHGVRPRIVAFDARERVERDSGAGATEFPQTLLLIGDKVVTDGPPAVRYPHQLDLGEAWKKLTGLPFVYAMWMCKASRMEEPGIATAATLLDRQLRHNLTRLDAIVSTRAPEHRWPVDLAAHYLGELLRFRVGEREREAVGRFTMEATALGLLPGVSVPWLEVPRESASLATV